MTGKINLRKCKKGDKVVLRNGWEGVYQRKEGDPAEVYSHCILVLRVDPRSPLYFYPHDGRFIADSTDPNVFDIVKVIPCKISAKSKLTPADKFTKAVSRAIVKLEQATGDWQGCENICHAVADDLYQALNNFKKSQKGV